MTDRSDSTGAADLEPDSQALAKEADDIRQMALMAHLLIVGNVHVPPDSTADDNN